MISSLRKFPRCLAFRPVTASLHKSSITPPPFRTALLDCVFANSIDLPKSRSTPFPCPPRTTTCPSSVTSRCEYFSWLNLGPPLQNSPRESLCDRPSLAVRVLLRRDSLPSKTPLQPAPFYCSARLAVRLFFFVPCRAPPNFLTSPSFVPV